MDYRNETNRLLFKSRQAMTVPSGAEENTLLASTALKNLTEFGFTFDEQAMHLLATSSRENIVSWYDDTVSILKEAIGDNHIYKPFYPNFPTDVMEKTDYELFVDQMKHYYTALAEDIGIIGKDVIENQNQAEKNKGVQPLESIKLKLINSIDENDVNAVNDLKTEIFANILKSKQTPSVSDMQDIINQYIETTPNWTINIQSCENRLLLNYLYAKALLDGKNTEHMPNLVTGDYLKIAQTMNYMKFHTTLLDLNVIEKQRIGNVSRPIRRFIAEGLNAQVNLEEDIARSKTAFKNLFKVIHIGEQKQCEHANEIAQKLRNNVRLETYYSKIERAFTEKDFMKALTIYKQRPGEFIKNFNRLLNVNIEDSQQKIAYAKALIKTSQGVFDKTRPEDLVNFVSYLKARSREDMMPIHNVKGNLYLAEKKYEAIPEKTADLFIEMAKKSIGQQIKTGKSLGKVYLDPMMESMALPRSNNSGTKALNGYTQGSRIPIERDDDGKPKNMRMLLWFGNPNGASRWNNIVDISAGFFKKQEDGTLEHTGTDLAWYDGRKSFGCYFSGDWIGAGKDGATEYIDLNMQELKNHGISHVMMYVNIWSGEQSFSDENVNFGWQERGDLEHSQAMNPKSVQQYCKLDGNAMGITPIIIDIEKGEIIWIDTLDFKAKHGSSLKNNLENIDKLLDKYGKGDRMTMAEMVKIAVEVNGGEFVKKQEDADIIFAPRKFEGTLKETSDGQVQTVITAIDKDIWIGQFMTPQKTDEELRILESEKIERDRSFSIAEIIESLPETAINSNGEQEDEKDKKMNDAIAETALENPLPNILTIIEVLDLNTEKEEKEEEEEEEEDWELT